MSVKVIRTHEICAGHRVVGHESKCRHLHGHNYVFHFHVAPLRSTVSVEAPGMNKIEMALGERNKLDEVGRVIDFSIVKSTLCEWLEMNWDHKFLHWEHDKLIGSLMNFVDPATKEEMSQRDQLDFLGSLVSLPFNPTAENLAEHMVKVVGPELLEPYGVELVQCVIEETSKCHVEYSK